VVGLLARIRSAFREGWHEPATHYGAVYVGRYRFERSKIAGTVRHLKDIVGKSPKAIVVLRDGDVIQSTDKFERHGKEWWFCVDLDREIVPDDVLKHSITAFAIDRVGERCALQVDGESLTELIKQARQPASHLELGIDFRRDGNSREYIQEGWYEPEPQHTWARGTHSTIVIPVKEPRCHYSLRIDAWPFAVTSKLEEQPLALSVNGFGLANFVVTPGQRKLECELPPDVLATGCPLIEFDHPNAARPSDLGVGKDNRELAIAFRSIEVRRLVDAMEK
jgi:hypothetical protein